MMGNYSAATHSSKNHASRVTLPQVSAFRLSRHHLARRAPASALTTVVGDMGGAQAQVLSAAQVSIWSRVRASRIQDLDAAIWKERSLVRAWGMRRTMFLFPSEELALYVRGTYRRSAYNFRWAQKQVSSGQALDRLLDDIMEILSEPRTRNNLAHMLKSKGYRVKSKAGGGWGDKRTVPWVEVGDTSLSVGFLLHVIGARDVICSGPNVGNESTFVRADKWLPHWKDIPIKDAEGKLLAKYLSAFGPATLADFALWAGMYVRDAKEIWALQSGNMAQVEVDGRSAWMLRSDLPELQRAELEGLGVRLLPFFDSFLLGHKSHRNIVDEKDHKRVYRAQGWVSPVVLVDGRAEGVWSYVQRKNDLEVRVAPFIKLSNAISSQIRAQALDLGRFLGCPNVKTTIS